MAIETVPPSSELSTAGRPRGSRTWGVRLITGTRFKLFLLLALALAPLIAFRTLDLATLRDQRIVEAQHRALQFAKDGADRQTSLVAQVSAILEVAVQVPAIQQGDVDACTKLLTGLKARNPWSDGFGLIDLRGRPVCSNDPTFRNVDLSDREYFQQAIAADRTFVSAFLISRTSGRKNVVLSRAVRDAAGDVNGVLIGTINLAWLGTLVEEVGGIDGGSMLLLDRTGTVLARYPDNEAWVGRSLAGVPVIAGLMRLDRQTWDRTGTDGVQRVGAVVPIAGSGEKLIVAFERARVLAEANAEFSRNLWRFAVLVLGALFLAWLGGEFLVLRWVRRLEAAAERLGRGEFATASGVPTAGGELAVVGRALDQAGASLAQREEALRLAETQTGEANRRLLLAEEIAQVGHWRLELASDRLTWSEGVYRIHGRDPKTFTLDIDAAIACYHPDDRAEVARLVATAIESRQGFDFSLRVLRADGAVREVVCRGLCEIAPSGELTAVFGTVIDVTELREAEREAAQTSTLLSATLESMDQGLVVVSPGRTIDVCNRRAGELLNLPADLMRSRPTAQAVLDHQWAQGEFEGADEAIRELMREDGTAFGPHTYTRTRPNGTVLDVRTVPMADGGLVRTYTDVTAQHAAERAITESEARYRLLAESTSDVITRLDLSFNRVYVSPACRALLGYEPQELCGQPPFTLVHEDDAVRVALAARALVTGGNGERATIDYRLRHRDGHWVSVEAGLTLERDRETGAPASIICSLRDITRRVEAERTVRETEARYRRLAETTSDVITHLSLPDFSRTYVSPACRALFGCEPDEMLGHRPSASNMHPEDVSAVRARAARLASGEAEHDLVTYRAQHKDGRWLWVEASMSLVRNEVTGGPSALVCTLRDVSERRRQADLLEQQARHLERAKVAAEAGARIKAEFLANMSHELRTPLTGMLGVHDLMQSDPALTDRQRRFVGLAQESGRSLLTIVNDILDFSKIEAGQMTIERVPFGLRDLVESCRQLGAETIKLEGVSLSANVDVDVTDLLLGDPTRVRQVLLNLTTNAIKFTTEGTVAVQVSTTASGALRFSVRDTGIGIAPEAVPYIFERFTQADGSTTRRFGGTGLGLAISKRLVELMGGVIGVESTQGQGSIFWFELPLRPADNDRLSVRRTSALGGAAARAWRILVAEDNAINQEIIHTVLAKKGHQVTMVGDGAQALGAVREGGFDIVLMDVQMPVLDGLAATGEIRALERSEGRPRMPIVALTANAMVEEARRCLKAGMDAHVAKPIDWTALFSTMDRLCAGYNLANAAALSSPSSGARVLDDSALESLAMLLGHERIRELLVSFSGELQRRLGVLETSGATARDLAAGAHALVSLAGQLGFSELSDFCQGLENEALAGGGLDRIGDLRIVAERALAAAEGSCHAASSVSAA